MNQVDDATPTTRLLVVEDDDTIRETVAEALEMEGFAVTAATNGRSAWDLLSRDSYDLVVLDLMLPGINGLDLCRQLRQGSTPPLILVVSARDTETDRVLGLDSQPGGIARVHPREEARQSPCRGFPFRGRRAPA